MDKIFSRVLFFSILAVLFVFALLPLASFKNFDYGKNIVFAVFISGSPNPCAAGLTVCGTACCTAAQTCTSTGGFAVGAPPNGFCCDTVGGDKVCGTGSPPNQCCSFQQTCYYNNPNGIGTCCDNGPNGENEVCGASPNQICCVDPQKCESNGQCGVCDPAKNAGDGSNPACPSPVISCKDNITLQTVSSTCQNNQCVSSTTTETCEPQPEQWSDTECKLDKSTGLTSPWSTGIVGVCMTSPGGGTNAFCTSTTDEKQLDTCKPSNDICQSNNVKKINSSCQSGLPVSDPSKGHPEPDGTTGWCIKKIENKQDCGCTPAGTGCGTGAAGCSQTCQVCTYAKSCNPLVGVSYMGQTYTCQAMNQFCTTCMQNCVNQSGGNAVPGVVNYFICTSCVAGEAEGPFNPGTSASCGPPALVQTPGLSCGTPQTTPCIPGLGTVTIGGCKQVGPMTECPYYHIDHTPCNSCQPGTTQPCKQGKKTCGANGQWGACKGGCSPSGGSSGNTCPDGSAQGCTSSGSLAPCPPIPCTPYSVQLCTQGSQTCDVNGNWGPCTGGCSPDGDSGNVCPDGSQQQCSGGQLTPCPNPCPTGQTYGTCNTCNADGTCTSQTGCCSKSADCSKCCPTGENNPHKECSGGKCQEVNTCGKDNCTTDASCCTAPAPTCPCGGTATLNTSTCVWTCPGSYTKCVSDSKGTTCQCVVGSGEDKCQSLGAVCVCCNPGDIANCTCGGGTKKCDSSGNWDYSTCSEHAGSQGGTCACLGGSGSDTCQVGQPSSCPLVGKTQNCPGGGVQTCGYNDTDPTKLAWSACPAIFCGGGGGTTTPFTACSMSGQCIASATGDGSNCSGSSDCTHCDYATKTCVLGFYDGSGCALGDSCAANPNSPCCVKPKYTACNSQGQCEPANVSDGSGCTVGDNSKCVECNYGTGQCVPGFYQPTADGTLCTLGADPKCATPPTCTACDSQGVCVLSNTCDGSGCTVGDNSACTKCVWGTCQCVPGFYDHSNCTLGTDTKCCPTPTATTCTSSGVCIASTVSDGSGCSTDANTAAGNPKCARCPNELCIPGFYDGSGCTLGTACNICKSGDKKTCACGDTVTCVCDANGNCSFPSCPNEHAQCVTDKTGIGNVCECVNTSGVDQCSVLGAQCGCCTPDQTLACACGGTKTCTEDSNGNWSWTQCSSHADAQIINGASVCACDPTPGTDSCQLGKPSSCLYVGTSKQCPSGTGLSFCELQDNNNTGSGLAWTACVASCKTPPPTCCSSSGQCTTCSVSDGSNCTPGPDPKCTHCDWNNKICVIGTFDGSGCSAGDSCAANPNSPCCTPWMQTACTSAGQCALAPVTDNSGCSIAANTASGNPLCTHCNWGTKECDTGFYDGSDCLIGSNLPAPNYNSKCTGTPPTQTACNPEGMCVQSYTSDGSKCTAGYSEKCAHCQCTSQGVGTCVLGPPYDHSGCTVGDDPICTADCSSTHCTSAGQCVLGKTDGSGCSISANTTAGNPLCTECDPAGSGECIYGFYDGSGCTQGTYPSYCQSTKCNSLGQCVYGKSDGSGCSVSANNPTTLTNSKCTECDPAGSGECIYGFYDGSGCTQGTYPSVCGTKCTSAGQCIPGKNDGSGCIVSNNTTAGNPGCTKCKCVSGAGTCVYGFYDNSGCIFGNNSLCANACHTSHCVGNTCSSTATTGISCSTNADCTTCNSTLTQCGNFGGSNYCSGSCTSSCTTCSGGVCCSDGSCADKAGDCPTSCTSCPGQVCCSDGSCADKAADCPTSCTGPGCPCVGTDCKCTGKDCICTGPDCDCTGTDCTCTGPDCACTGPDCSCTGPSCSCTGSDCPCVGADCGCAGPYCSCSGSDCPCTGTNCVCTGANCDCTGSNCVCTGPDCKKQKNDPPSAYNLLAYSGDYCSYALTGMPASGLVVFQWDYKDQESDQETNWQMQISTNSRFDNYGIIFDSGIVPGSANRVQLPVFLSLENSTTYCKTTPQKCSFINYGVPYYWRVKVWENSDASPNYSAWASYIDSHADSKQNIPDLNDYIVGNYPDNADDKETTSTSPDPEHTYTYIWSHPAPMVSFTPPSTVTPGQTAIFKDSSSCFNDDGSPYPCSASNTNTYQWWYDYVNNPGTNSGIINCSVPTSTAPAICSTITSPAYLQPKTYTAKLQICDTLGCCSETTSVKVGTSNANKIPLWQELSPFQAPS